MAIIGNPIQLITVNAGTTPNTTVKSGTYRFNNDLIYPGSTGAFSKEISINFTSYGNSYVAMRFVDSWAAGWAYETLEYKSSNGTYTTVYTYNEQQSSTLWTNVRYKYIKVTSNTSLDPDSANIFFSNAQHSQYNLIMSSDNTVSTTSTSAASAFTLALGSSAFTKDCIILVQIRDKAGPRTGYFLGSDSYFFNYQKANSTTTTLTYAGRVIHSVNSSGQYYQYPQGTNAGYGLYGYSINSSGTLTVRQRYNASYSFTINGTYNTKVYELDYTLDQGNPFNFTY